MKLTAAIAASYFGAEVICAPYGGQPERKITGTMIGLNNYGIDIKFPEWQSPHQIAIDKCQLLLTPLSKMSEVDLSEIAKMHNASWCKLDDNFLQVIKDDNMVECYYILNGHLPTFMTDYLRSKGYDCGHGSIPSLIAAGVAVEKKEK